MASKQLGKLRQWAGEVISTRDKITVPDEFKDLERDIELRRLGNWKLQVTAVELQRTSVKKRECEALLDQKEKLLPLDAFGIVMIQHGEEFGEESAYGMSLVGLGKAHCKLATLQESFAVAFENTFIASAVRTAEEIKEYQKEKKKLDARRAAYDSALAKYDKVRTSKKEKERKEAEEEYEKAKEIFEETEQDVYDRMTMIQENEVMQLKDLTTLLELEIAFAQQHLEVLKDVKQNWVDEETITQLESSIKVKRSPPPPPPPISSITTPDSSFASISRRGSVKEPVPVDSASEEEEDVKTSSSLRSRAKSFTRRKSDAPQNASRPTSRPQSRADDRKKRSRTDSNATATTIGDKDRDRDSDDEDKEKEKDKTKRRSMAGWASSKVSSISFGRKDKERERDKDTDKFTSLMGDRDDVGSGDDDDYRSRGDDSQRSSPTKRSRSKSFSKSKSTGTSPSPKVSTKMLRRGSSSKGNSPHSSPLTGHPTYSKRKLVEAINDFTASTSDELSFRSGDTILIINEVVDDWWMGELQTGTGSGKRGMFPLSYTRSVLQASGSSSSSSLSMLAPGLTRRKSKSDKKPDIHGEDILLNASEDDSIYNLSPMQLTPQVMRHDDKFGYGAPPSASDTEDDQHPFGDHNVAPTYPEPIFPAITPTRSNRDSIAESIDSFSSDHFTDERESLMPSSSDSIDRLELNPPSSRRGSNTLLIPSSGLAPPLPVRRLTDTGSGSSTPPTIPSRSPSLQPQGKKVPPPPPPRRPQPSATPTPPVLPARPSTMSNTPRTNSSLSVSSGGSYVSSTNSYVAVAKSAAPASGSPSPGPLHVRVQREIDEELTYSPFDTPNERSTFFNKS